MNDLNDLQLIPGESLCHSYIFYFKEQIRVVDFKIPFIPAKLKIKYPTKAVLIGLVLVVAYAIYDNTVSVGE